MFVFCFVSHCLAIYECANEAFLASIADLNFISFIVFDVLIALFHWKLCEWRSWRDEDATSAQCDSRRFKLLWMEKIGATRRRWTKLFKCCVKLLKTLIGSNRLQQPSKRRNSSKSASGGLTQKTIRFILEGFGKTDFNRNVEWFSKSS